MIRDVTYCLDTEGPLTEDPYATITRLIREHGLSQHVTGPAEVILADVQAGKYGDRLADVASPSRLGFLSTWAAVEDMLDDLNEHRKDYADSFGNPLRISWFVVDLIGYRTNPRKRAFGQHAVWDRVGRFVGSDDSIGWHVHMLTPDRNPIAHGSSWTSVVHEHEESLCRRLLDQGHFPGSFRAGGCIERNDLSHWLERFIPMDYSCLPGARTHGMDWPTWERYHPSWDDYRLPGTMRRSVLPCYDADSWANKVEAIPKGSRFTFSNHDRKPVRPDLDRIVQLLNSTGEQWRWTTATPTTGPLPEVELTANRNACLTSRPIFGEPFIAVEADGLVYRVNAIPEQVGQWTLWRIDVPERLQRIAVAVTTPDGRVGIDRR